MKIIDDCFMICDDCLQAIINDDYTGIQYSYEVEEDVNKRIAEIKKGIWNATEHGKYHLVYNNDHTGDTCFMWKNCECCNALPGNRNRMAIIGK